MDEVVLRSAFEETTRRFGRVKEVGEGNGMNCGTNERDLELTEDCERVRADGRDARPKSKSKTINGQRCRDLAS